MVFHHHPEESDETSDLLNIIHLADHIAHESGADLFDGEAMTPEWRECREILHVDDAAYENIKTICLSAATGPNEYLSIIQ